jgi:hypothetical protein
MYKSLEIINPLQHKGWDELLLSSQHYSFFHTQAWAKVLFSSYGYEPAYFTAIYGQGQPSVVPLMSINSFLTGKRGISLPFSDFCEPILTEPEEWQNIFAAMAEFGKQNHWKYIEWRGGENLIKAGTYYSKYYVHNLKLSPQAEEVYARFRDSTKRNIQKAIREQVESKVSTSMDSLESFYQLNCLTRKKHGLPPQPYSFFRNLYRCVISRGKGIIVLGLHQSKVIAAGLYLHFGDKAIYKYGASDNSYQNLRPNNLVMWRAIQWYSENGYQEFSFGRTSPHHEGLLQFKRGWGAAEETIKYFRHDLKKNEFLREKQDPLLPMIVFKKLPTPALKLAGYFL